MRELGGSKNTIGQMASVLKKLQKATFTFFVEEWVKMKLMSGHDNIKHVFIDLYISLIIWTACHHSDLTKNWIAGVRLSAG